MARRFSRRDVLDGEGKPTSGPISLAGLIKLQPSRKKGSRPWRPLQLSDFGDDEQNNDGEDSDRDGTSTAADDFSVQQRSNHSRSDPISGHSSIYPRYGHLGTPRLQTKMNMSPVSPPMALPTNDHGYDNTEPTLTRTDSGHLSPNNARHGVLDDYVRLFGKQLPDPIRLHEEVGQFDGQVTFIAHPNRDVSAHQWSIESFQWINIGLYSHNRRRIEGSLASDRLRGSSIPPDSIEYFKAVAEQRQIQSSVGSHSGHNSSPEALRQPDMRDAGQFGSLSTMSESSEGRAYSSLSQSESRQADSRQSNTPTPHTVTRETLDDPFVTPARNNLSSMTNPFRFGLETNRGAGSMDFGYKFPINPIHHVPYPKSSSQTSDAKSERQLYLQREEEHLESMRRAASTEDYGTPQLRDVGFGEEAVNGYESSARRAPAGHPLMTMSTEDLYNRQQLKNRLVELGDSARRPSLQGGALFPVPAQQGPARGPFHLVGPTVANPNRVTSTLNANAPPYRRPSLLDQGTEDAESDVTAVNLQEADSLLFSDPDGMRHPHIHEIVIGMGWQAPTPQNFKGPFFTDHMPTTIDPTTALAYQMDEKAKLEHWFRDGQRPSRQQDFARSIMATADADSKARNSQHFGAIGDSRAQDPGRFANTPTFVRLYENLQAYVDESQAGGGQSYFTRAWKLAPQHMRDFGPDGNFSFFDKKRTLSPSQTRNYSQIHQSFATSSLCGFSSVDTWPN